jgi:hypothetical protein
MQREAPVTVKQMYHRHGTVQAGWPEIPVEPRRGFGPDREAAGWSHMTMEPPKDAEPITGDVSSRLSLDRDRLRKEVGERFSPGTHSNDLIEVESLAGDVVCNAWGEIAFECDQALADVRELYLVQAARVLEAQDDLRQNGSESWIARAVIHREAFAIAWDVLEDRGLLTELPD